MPKFGELLATNVWAAVARTLTDFSAEEIFDLGRADAFTPTTRGTPTSSGTADAFGSWVELVADVGEGKRLIAVAVQTIDALGVSMELEVGEGTSGNEAAIARHSLGCPDGRQGFIIPFWVALTDNSRLAVRTRDDVAAAKMVAVAPIIM